MEKKKIILGIDASIKSSGLAILDGETGEIIAYDRLPIKTKDFNGDENKKIQYIAHTCLELCKAYNVTHISIEDNYIGKHQGTGKTLAKLQGGIITLLLENGYNLIYTYSPSQWRKIVTGTGKSKEGAFKWLRKNVIDLGEYNDRDNKDKNSDLMDSIGIALCLYKKLNNIK